MITRQRMARFLLISLLLSFQRSYAEDIIVDRYVYRAIDGGNCKGSFADASGACRHTVCDGTLKGCANYCTNHKPNCRGFSFGLAGEGQGKCWAKTIASCEQPEQGNAAFYERRVMQQPAITIMRVQKVNPGQPTRLMCAASGIPRPLAKNFRLRDAGRNYAEMPIDNELRLTIDATQVEAVIEKSEANQMFVCEVETPAGRTEKSNYSAVHELPFMRDLPRASQVTSDRLQLSWKPWQRGDGDGPVLEYHVYIWRMEAARSEGKMHVGDDILEGTVQSTSCSQIQCTYTRHGLQPNTDYFVAVAAMRLDPGGEGPLGHALEFRTDCVPPHGPVQLAMQTLRVDPKNDSLAIADLFWKTPTRAETGCNGVREYIISVFRRHPSEDSSPWRVVRLAGADGNKTSVETLEWKQQYFFVLRYTSDMGKNSSRSPIVPIYTKFPQAAAVVDSTDSPSPMTTTQTSVSEATNNSEGVPDNTKILIGLIAGAVFLVILIVLLVLFIICIVRYIRNRKSSSTFGSHDRTPDTSETDSGKRDVVYMNTATPASGTGHGSYGSRRSGNYNGSERSMASGGGQRPAGHPVAGYEDNVYTTRLDMAERGF